MQILSNLIAVVTLPIMLTACAVNIDKAIAEFSKPKVAFATPAAWRCDADAMKGPGKHGVESCDRCSNTGRTLETVTINGDPHSVAPKANVLICQTQAMVE
jgi:hypothetical protein